MCVSRFISSMNSRYEKNVKNRIFKRYNSTLENKNDSSGKKIEQQPSWSNQNDFKKFTPFSKIPAIGEKVQNFKNTNSRFSINYHSDTDKHSVVGLSKIPVFQTPNLQNNSNDSLNKRSRLSRRNTYIVLEPLVCINSEKGQKKFKKPHTRLIQDSDTDMSASDEMSPKIGTGKKKNEKGLNALNYLFNNLKFSRNAENDLLLPKNNPWLL